MLKWILYQITGGRALNHFYCMRININPTIPIMLFFAIFIIGAGCASHNNSPSYTPTTIYFNPAGSGFYDMPFPNNFETDAEGHPLLAGFPNPFNIQLLNQYLETARTEVVGFGTNSPMYLHFTGDSISLTTLPQTPADSLNPDSSMYLVNVDPSSSQYGSRIPVIWLYQLTGTAYMPSDTLAVSPMYGFPLSGVTEYALVLTNSVKDINEHPIAMPLLMKQALLSSSSNNKVLSRLISIYKPLHNYLVRNNIDPHTIGAATVFTTQNPTKDLQLIRQMISTLTALGISTMAYYGTGANYVYGNNNYYVFGGTYTSTNFQVGTPPYSATGGNFTFDTNGKPVIQRWESLDFSLTVPFGTPPPNGWPIALYAHGTGGNHMTFIYSGVAGILAAKGIAVIGIDQPLHGNRVNPPLSASDLDLASFNFFNPDEGRTNFRQSAVDSFVLTRLIKTGGLYVTSGISPTGQKIVFDTNDIVFIGHSQGGITGTLYAALEPGIRGAVLSGDGGDLSLTILYRKSPNIKQPVELLFNIPPTESLTTFHPLIGLVQMLVDVTDPINYGHYLINPFPGGAPKDVILTEGLLDPYAPPVTTEALAVASGIPLIQPVSHPVEGFTIIGLSTFTPPVNDNVTAPDGTKVTAGLLQFPYDDHFAIFTDTTAIYKYSGFLQSLAYTGTAIIP